MPLETPPQYEAIRVNALVCFVRPVLVVVRIVLREISPLVWPRSTSLMPRSGRPGRKMLEAAAESFKRSSIETSSSAQLYADVVREHPHQNVLSTRRSSAGAKGLSLCLFDVRCESTVTLLRIAVTAGSGESICFLDPVVRVALA